MNREVVIPLNIKSMKALKLPASASGMLALLSLLIWILALPLTGLAFYSSEYNLTGLQILGMGWLSLLMLNFAWFANVFFLRATAKLALGKGTATKSALVSFVLAFDTFRFDSLLTNEGGSTTPVYGYGWGAILWLASMTVILMAAGTRELELSVEKKQSSHAWGTRLRAGGILALVALLCMTVVFAINDQKNANLAEKARLSSIAFKRGPICKLEGPVPSAILQLDGPLEVVSDNTASPFDSPSPLLSWGIPIVRMKGLDYYMVDAANSKLTAAKTASGIHAARLVAKREWIEGEQASRYHTVLSSADGKVVSFDQTWEPEPQDRRHCPEYSSSPTQTEQPRKVVMSALVIPGAKPLSVTGDSDIPQARGSIPRVAASVLGQWSSSQENKPFENVECKDTTGFQYKLRGSHREMLFLGQPFLIRDVFYFPGRDDLNKAICSGDYVYLYGDINYSSDQYSLILQKHSLIDFAEVWTKLITIAKPKIALPERITHIRSLEEGNGVLTIEFLNISTRQGITIEAVLASSSH